MRGMSRHAIALGSMCIGSTAVFAVVYAMNAAEQPPAMQAESNTVEFKVERKKPPKRERKKVERKEVRQLRSAPRAPMPNLAASLSGASFDLPTFTAGGLEEVSKDLLGDTNKKMVMTEGAVDKVAQPLRRTRAEYPAKARKLGIQGYVKMSLFINESGSVEKVQVLDASPPGVFEETAQNAIASWEFQPSEYQGQPVAGWVTQTVRFELT